jgi:hypothetical protein
MLRLLFPLLAVAFAARSLALGIHVPRRSNSRSIVSAETEYELLLIIAFCLLGLFVTFFLMVCFPNLGGLVAEYNQL